MTRRMFLNGVAVTAIGATLWRMGFGEEAAAAAFPFTLSDAQWRKRLSPQAYAVLRKAATEAPHSSPLDKEKRSGIFKCAGCEAPLFDSRTKFNSHTGWPSFYQPIGRQAVQGRQDTLLGYARTEILCARCGGHLGHVFDDGPRPTGLRYCMNGVALHFVPR